MIVFVSITPSPPKKKGNWNPTTNTSNMVGKYAIHQTSKVDKLQITPIDAVPVMNYGWFYRLPNDVSPITS